MPDAPAPQLPELARSLRSLGAQRGDAADAAHAAIFLPLLDARTRSAGAATDVVLAALRGDALAARIEARAVDAAVQGVEQPAQARALSAQTSELIEPLRSSLLVLDTLSPAARDDAAGWEAWVAQLRRVFAFADAACEALAALLTDRQTGEGEAGWFQRLAR